MNNISIPNDKWMEVFNAVALLLFFNEVYENDKGSIQAINKRYYSFCSRKGLGPPEDIHFEGSGNMLAFCYLIIVRINELIVGADIAAKANGDARKQFFKYTIETAKQDGFTSFADITAKYCVDIRAFADGDGQPDEEKLYQLFRHIRHSVSHFSYEIDFSHNSVHFKSTKFDMAMPMFQVINLTAQFGCWVDHTLRQQHLLS